MFLACATLRTGRSFAWQSSPLPVRSSHRRTFTSLYSATTKESSSTSQKEEPDNNNSKKSQPVPITLLSGFLGTGKTTTLKHLLENTDNVKIGVIVNDVASVNIDAKLVAGENPIEGMIELQNGCACCSLADELFFSVDNILKDRQLDAIVVELSGVGDPMAIKNNWLMAPPFIKEKANVAKVVTVLDAASFGTDFMTWDMARERKGWVSPSEEFGPGVRKVSELLAEQVEAADLILLNKIDMAENEEQIQVAESVAKALNEKAELLRVEFGKIAPAMVLGDLITKQEQDCKDPDCSDPTHSHSHSHDHACSDPDCTDESHSHAHDHACSDPECSDESHSHSHSHEHSDACNDPDCTDPSHSHSHSHATSTDQLGIVNFVYKASVPFHPERIMNVLNKWPVPVKDTLDLQLLRDAQTDGFEVGGQVQTESESPFVGALRSKGFCWFAPNKWSGANDDAWRHDTAMFWSHAGKGFAISSAGKWWGTLDREQMKKYFVLNMKEYDRILKEDFVTEEFGDRRNELVFIGVNLDEKRITDTLNECLLTEEEMDKYRQQLRNYRDTTITTSGGLFDVGGVEHADAQ